MKEFGWKRLAEKSSRQFVCHVYRSPSKASLISYWFLPRWQNFLKNCWRSQEFLLQLHTPYFCGLRSTQGPKHGLLLSWHEIYPVLGLGISVPWEQRGSVSPHHYYKTTNRQNRTVRFISCIISTQIFLSRVVYPLWFLSSSYHKERQLSIGFHLGLLWTSFISWLPFLKSCRVEIPIIGGN